jgi:hypothetical protein
LSSLKQIRNKADEINVGVSGQAPELFNGGAIDELYNMIEKLLIYFDTEVSPRRRPYPCDNGQTPSATDRLTYFLKHRAISGSAENVTNTIQKLRKTASRHLGQTREGLDKIKSDKKFITALRVYSKEVIPYIGVMNELLKREETLAEHIPTTFSSFHPDNLASTVIKTIETLPQSTHGEELRIFREGPTWKASHPKQTVNA